MSESRVTGDGQRWWSDPESPPRSGECTHLVWRCRFFMAAAMSALGGLRAEPPAVVGRWPWTPDGTALVGRCAGPLPFTFGWRGLRAQVVRRTCVWARCAPRGRRVGSSKAWTCPCAHTRTHTYTYTHAHAHKQDTHTLIITHHSKHIHAHIHTQHHTHTPHTANRTPHTPPFVVSIGLVDNCSHFLFKSFFVFGLSFGQRCFHN